MRTQGVIKSFDVGKNSVLSSVAGNETMQMNEFALEAAEEILGNGIVERVALAGHALADTELGQAIPIGGSSILNAAVRVENEGIAWFFTAYSHV